MNQVTTSKRNIKARDRERDAVALRLAGASYDKIAEAVGYSNRSGAYHAVKKYLNKTAAVALETAEELKQQELQRLDAMFLAAYQSATKGDVKYIDSCLKIMAARAKLLGLNAPEKVDVDGNVATPKTYADWVKIETMRRKHNSGV